MTDLDRRGFLLGAAPSLDPAFGRQSFVAHREALDTLPALNHHGEAVVLRWLDAARRLVEHEDYMLHVMRRAGLPCPEPYGIVEITPAREYLLVTEFLTYALDGGMQRIADGLWVTIFPEGTRVAVGKRGRYGIGGALLATRSGTPI